MTIHKPIYLKKNWKFWLQFKAGLVFVPFQTHNYSKPEQNPTIVWILANFSQIVNKTNTENERLHKGEKLQCKCRINTARSTMPVMHNSANTENDKVNGEDLFRRREVIHYDVRCKRRNLSVRKGASCRHGRLTNAACECSPRGRGFIIHPDLYGLYLKGNSVSF